MIWLINFVRILAQALSVAIILRALLSWLPGARTSRFMTLLYEITEPILGPIRRLLPGMGGFDLSPMLGLILIQVLETVLLRILNRLAS